MAQNSLIQVRVDHDLKANADALFSDLGLDTPTAIRMFLNQSLMNNGLPFDVRRVPNHETLEAMKEAEVLLNDSNAKTYNSFSEILSEAEMEIADEA